MKLLDHTVILFWIFWGMAEVFSTMAILFYIPTNSVQEFQFLQILTNTFYFLGFLFLFLFGSSHFNRGKGLATRQRIYLPLCLHYCDQKQRSEQRPWCLENRVLIAHPGFHKLCADCSRNRCTAAWHWMEVWEMGSCYQTRSWNWPKLFKTFPGRCKPSIE